MKCIYFIFAFCLIKNMTLVAQTKTFGRNVKIRNNQFASAFSDTSNSLLFNKQKDLEKLIVRRDDAGKSIVRVFSKHKSNAEFYDFGFEGDSCYFLERYGILQLDFPVMKENSVNRKKMIDILAHGGEIYLTRDSVHYTSDRNHISKDDQKNKSGSGIGNPAKLTTKKIELAIADQLKAVNIESHIDSIIVFRAYINKIGKLDSLEKIVGKSSTFSVVTMTELQRKGNDMWAPAYAFSRGAIPAYVRIYVKINQDGRIIIKTPRILGTFSGE